MTTTAIFLGKSFNLQGFHTLTSPVLSGSDSACLPVSFFPWRVSFGYLLWVWEKHKPPGDRRFESLCPFARVPLSAILWMDEILHHQATMRHHCLLVFTGESIFQGFSGGAKWISQPSTVATGSTGKGYEVRDIVRGRF